MANSFDASKPELWGFELQMDLRKKLVALSIADTDFAKINADLLKMGDKIHSPYGSRPTIQSYTKTDITIRDSSTTDDSITISTAKAAGSYYDDLDAIQDVGNWIAREKGGMSYLLSNALDQAVLANYGSANSTVIDTDVGQSNSGLISLDKAVIKSIFIQAGMKLNVLGVPMDNRFACIGPQAFAVLSDLYSDRETVKGDGAFENGVTGLRVQEFEIFLTNNNPFSATWTPDDNPSNTQTLTIGGAVLTFATTANAANYVKIGSDTAGTIDNLVLAINNSGTGDGTDYYALDDDTRFKLQNAGVVATDGTTALTIVGYGDLHLATSVAADEWTVETSHMVFGRKNSISMYAQKMPTVKEQDAQKRFGKYILAVDLYGSGVWNRRKDELVDVRVDANNF